VWPVPTCGVTIWVVLAGAFLAEVTPAARPVRETGPDVVATSEAPQARRPPRRTEATMVSAPGAAGVAEEDCRCP
jgi:hypothetical protein